MKAELPSRAKVAAYNRYWKEVRRVQDEMSKQHIHTNLSVGEVAGTAHLSYVTVARFFHFGRYGRYNGYSRFHGPNVTTVFGVAAALDMEISIKPKKGNGRG